MHAAAFVLTWPFVVERGESVGWDPLDSRRTLFMWMYFELFLSRGPVACAPPPAAPSFPSERATSVTGSILSERARG